MKAIMVMFDSLNRRMLQNYGCEWTQTPNFKRLGEKTATFDRFYVGSLPCMPARRDLHTGRYSFLHRSWGPLEPFDNSMPEILKHNGIYTRLISDHYHYWEDGGATYHSRYSTWDCVRGQEADQWSWNISDPEIPDHVPTMREFTHPEWWRDSWYNKEIIHETGQWPQNLVFDKGIEFLEANCNEDNWFVQIETFDPHEPFDSPDEFRKLYYDDYTGKHLDWPPYAPVTESKSIVEHVRKRYAALLSMCDRNLGRVLDFMDEHDMWKDTMLIVNTDHGFMLGEKDWWAKSVMPCYNELANTPFFIWDPRCRVKGERRQALAQTIDIPATLLDFFNIEIPKEMQGYPLGETVKNDTEVRDYALFGFHGSFVNITDGNCVYMRSAKSVSNAPLNEYTLFPTKQQGFITNNELSKMESVPAFDFTKGCRLMKIPNASRLANATFCNSFQYGNMLWDLKNDPEQLEMIDDPSKEADMLNHMIALMKKNDAPMEQYNRLGIDFDGVYDADKILEDRKGRVCFEDFEITKKHQWTQDAKNIFIGMLSLMPSERTEEYFEYLESVVQKSGRAKIDKEHFVEMAKKFYSEDEGKIFYFLAKLARVK